jgi:hypothetical protein
MESATRISGFGVFGDKFDGSGGFGLGSALAGEPDGGDSGDDDVSDTGV